MHPLIHAHREQLLALAKRRGMTSVRVFGSMGRDNENDPEHSAVRDDSDVDLLVTLAPGVSALALGGLLIDAQELLGRRVDVVTEASLHPALRDRVLAAVVVGRWSVAWSSVEIGGSRRVSAASTSGKAFAGRLAVSCPRPSSLTWWRAACWRSAALASGTTQISSKRRPGMMPSEQSHSMLKALTPPWRGPQAVARATRVGD